MYCAHCGAEVAKEAVVCPHCGCATGTSQEIKGPSGKAKAAAILKKIARIFMIVYCAVLGMYIIPLCWVLPMTLHYLKCQDENLPVSLAFKICTIIFISPIPGALMIVADEL